MSNKFKQLVRSSAMLSPEVYCVLRSIMDRGQMKSIHEKEYKLFIIMLKNWRVERNLTQKDLSVLLGFPNHSYISKIETCERRIDVIEFRKICLALEIDPAKFLESLDRAIRESSNEINP